MRFDRLYHGKKTLRTTIIALLIVSVLMLPAIAEINKVGTYFWIDPERNIYGDPTDTFTIDIKIANAPATWAWGLKLMWNSSVLNVTNIAEGPWLNPPATVFLATFDNTAGYAIIENTALVPNPGAVGNGILCNVTFLVTAVGRSALSLVDTFLVDNALVKTDYPNNDGYFCANDAFSCLHDVYVASVDVNDTEPQQGDDVLITVIIHNEGNHTQLVNVTVYATTALYPPVPIYTTPVSILLVPCVPEPVGPIVWDTTLVPGEVWTINTEVIKVDAVDDDPHDNLYIGPAVTVKSTHDVKVTDVTVLTPVVHKGDIAQVNVTIHNEGKVSEDVRVILFAEDQTQLLNFTFSSAPFLEPCLNYTWLPPYGPPPENCTWWHIIEAPDAPWLVSKEFHVDELIGDQFHIDFVWPHYPEELTGWVLAEQEIVIDEIVVPAAPCVPVTVTFDWNTSLVDPKDYVIAALALPVVGEEMKNWPDNKIKDPENTITVTYADLAMASVNILDAGTCYSGGFNPVAVPEFTVANLGLEPVKALVYFLADPNLTQAGDQTTYGVAVVGPIAPGAVQTFRGCAPFGGWDMNNPFIAPPYNFPVPGTTYYMIASLTPSPGYSDDNPANNANFDVWTLPVVSHDVKVTDISIRNWAYATKCILVDVTIASQVNVAETVDVILKNGSSVVGTETGVAVAALDTTTVTFKLTAPNDPCTWQTLDLEANVTIVGQTDDDPCDNVQIKFGAYYVRILGDVDDSDLVFASDMVRVLIAFGGSGSTYPEEDVDCNGTVFASDMVIILIKFGASCP